MNSNVDVIEEPLLGTAQWMPPVQAVARCEFQYGDLWLGRNADDNRTPLGRDDDSHVLLCAKTRSGKGRALITNNLLLWPGSLFVNDPKGENASITAARRGDGSDHVTESLGQKVCVLDSHLRAKVDDRYRAYFNPLAELDPDDPDTPSKAGLIAESCVSKHQKTDATWDNKAQTFIRALALHIASDPLIRDEDRNLVTLRRFIVSGDVFAVEYIKANADPEKLKASPPDGISLLLEAMAENNAFDGIIADQANSYLESYRSQPKMWNSIRTSAEEHTDWIDDTRMRQVLRSGTYENTFRAHELQSREGGVSVYVCLPSSMKDTLASWPRILVNLILAAAQDRGDENPATSHQTLMMLDEFATMERMKRIETAAADIAGAGVKMFFVVQSLTQLKGIYDDAWEAFASAADTHIYYGFNDNFTAEYVSKRLGEVEVIRKTRSGSTATSETTTSADMTGGSSSVAHNTSDARTRSHNSSRGGGWGSSSGSSSGTSDTTGWGPSIFFRTLETTNQFARQSGSNYGTSRQENYQKGTGKSRTKTKGRTDTEGTNWSQTESLAQGRTDTEGWSEAIHKKPLAAVNELMRLFGSIEDEDDPAYPGIGLISTASGHPMLVQKSFYDADRFYEGLFDPHPKHGFLPLPEIRIPQKRSYYLFDYNHHDLILRNCVHFEVGEVKRGAPLVTLESTTNGFLWRYDLLSPADIEFVTILGNQQAVDALPIDQVGRKAPTSRLDGFIITASDNLDGYFTQIHEMIGAISETVYNYAIALNQELQFARHFSGSNAVTRKFSFLDKGTKESLEVAQKHSQRYEADLLQNIRAITSLEQAFIGSDYPFDERQRFPDCINQSGRAFISDFR